MKPVEQAFATYAPGYEMTYSQRKGIKEATDKPEDIALGVRPQIDSLRRHLALDLGISKDRIEPIDVADQVTTDKAVDKHNGTRGFVLRRLSPEQAIALGKRLADPLHAIYREVLGREPDVEGLAFWRGHYEGGMPLSEVIGYIERSDEATG